MSVIGILALLLQEKKGIQRGSTGKTASPRLRYGGKFRLPSGLVRKGSAQRRWHHSTAKENAVVFAQYVRRNSDSLRHIIQFVDYLKERRREPWEERKFFDKEKVDLDRNDVIERFSRNRGKEVAMYKIVLSPGDNSVNLRDFTKHTMERLEENLGYKVNWVAMDQYNTDHYHSHVIIAGRIPEQKSRTRGKGEDADRYLDNWAKYKEGHDLRLNRNNLDAMREAGNDYLRKNRSIDRELDLAVDREFGFANWSYDSEIMKELGIKIWHQDRDLIEREFGLTGWKTDYKLLRELGLDKYDYDKRLSHEFGFDRKFDLGKPFRDIKTTDLLKASDVYSIQRGEDKEHELKLDGNAERTADERDDLPSLEPKQEALDSFNKFNREDLATGLYGLSQPGQHSFNPEVTTDLLGRGVQDFQADRSDDKGLDNLERTMFETEGQERRRNDEHDRGPDRGQ